MLREWVRDGKKLDNLFGALVDVLDAAIAEARARQVSPHGLRATYISSVISTKGLEAPRRLARHALGSVTTRYSRWAELAEE